MTDEESLRAEAARLAGAVAETEDKVAAVRRTLARDHPDDAERHLAAADEAEQFAAQERAKQREYEKPAEA